MEGPNFSLEEVLRRFPYALFILIGGDRKSSTGIVASWAMQTSFRPPLIAVAIELESNVRVPIETSGRFSVNFLQQADRDVVTRFMKSAVSEGETLAGRPVAFLAADIPSLGDAAVAIGCRVRSWHETGDHLICVGEVADAVLRHEGAIMDLRETGLRYFK
jgi:flavin reductase (DIM6/NTAB) family NADH-FMN oxidoreductase RutF